MKLKVLMVLVGILIGFSGIHGALVDVYKKGIIKLVADPSFGKDTDWESIFFYPSSSLTIIPDGSIFIAYGKTSNIIKFTPEGQKVHVFSQSGMGPGDTNSPYCSSILDNKYLIVGENAENRRFSVFDFKGKFISVIRTKSEDFNVTGLKNGYIAYYTLNFGPDKQKGISVAKVVIHIVNMNSKSDIEFPFGEYEMRNVRLKSGGMYIPGSFLGQIFLKKTKEGNLLVSNSNSPNIYIYSPDGKLVNRFKLNYNPFPVTQKYIETIKENAINSSLPGLRNPELLKKIRTAIASIDFGFFFNQYLPYYNDIIVDLEGNFLIFKRTDSFNKSKETFQVYSPEGKYICETILDKGMFNLEIDSRAPLIQFTSTGIYAYVSYEGEDDTIYKIIKVKL